jgi:hypothetical protein
VGAHAALIELLDRGLTELQHTLREPEVASANERGEHDIAQLDYYIRILIAVSEHGAAGYVDGLGQERAVSGVDAWLELFAPNVLDVFCSRATDLLLAGLDGNSGAARGGEAYRDLLQYTIPEVLRAAGHAAIPVFPLAGISLDASSMRVMGRVRRPGFEGQVVGVMQYGIRRGRQVVREAQVTTG